MGDISVSRHPVLLVGRGAGRTMSNNERNENRVHVPVYVAGSRSKPQGIKSSCSFARIKPCLKDYCKCSVYERQISVL